jgi:uncharacterized repeat protein (TIGR03803 family)
MKIPQLLIVLMSAMVLDGLALGQSCDFTNYVALFSFDGTNGANPYGDLIEGVDGRLYGVTISDGLTNATFPEGQGTVFCLNKDGTGFTVLHRFGTLTNDGQMPSGALLEDKTNRVLYGTTEYGGGLSNAGTIFRLNEDGSNFCIVKSFTGGTSDGGNPQAGLLKASDGELYGTASVGSGGLVFRIDADGSNYIVISSLADSIGDIVDNPEGSLIEETNGQLCGAGQSGWTGLGPGGEINTYGALFYLNKDGSGLAVDSVAFFSENSIFTLQQPNGPLLDGGDGLIYGTTENGASPQGGCVFCFSTGGIWNFTVVSDLGGPLFQPHGGLIKGPDGNLYGTASNQNPHIIGIGQTPTYGGVFEMAPSGTNFNVLKVFYSSPDGATPQGRLLLADDGGMYGVTSGGGIGYGTIFALYPDARSKLTSVTHNSDDSLSLAGIGAVGTAFRLQGADSPASSVWEDISTNAASITGGVLFTNVSATASCCFFRLVTP